jgi:hypothetical protein
MAEHPPGTVGILTNDLTRYAWAMASLRALQVPDGTQFSWVTGQWVARAVNLLIAQMRPDDEWICLLTDDNPCPPDLVLRLLDHQVPIVAPLVCLRLPPFHPALAHLQEDGTFVSYTFDELPPPPGLLPVTSMGGPGVVLRREVIEKVGMPFFENMPGSREVPNEDIYTFWKCQQAGFQPLVDLSLTMDHCLPAMVTPQFDPDTQRWSVRLAMALTAPDTPSRLS